MKQRRYQSESVSVIRVENILLFLTTSILFVLGYLVYLTTREKKNNKSSAATATCNVEIEQPGLAMSSSSMFIPSWPYNNLPKDVLLDPYSAPYKDERYLIPGGGAIPINISTNVGAIDTPYRQVGMLTPLHGTSKDNILPLMGRPLFTSRDKWQYYSISNQHNNIKLPILFRGKSALTDYGVDKIYSGDTVYVEGYNEAFKTTVYENDTIKYLPFV